MVNRKSIRTRGKLQLSKYFQDLKKGDSVAVVKERSVASNFPENIQGRTGYIEEKKGNTYIVRIMDHKMEKRYIIAPIHLKKIKIITN